ncbi:sensor histidine kinase [Actinomadura alba]|uniref:Signal transduction histidine-protein kinase/phosphatase MprB n=1 Tax=Actinomadura alba TaxID=406431 RepID=A0ABR7LMT9_9ACTN|nr:HAMP domain-containing sensor histidine kinase [Actinomadura alba]MBC6465807.1 HAMP domain-containing histidine kinase [Actinomadura alba]
MRRRLLATYLTLLVVVLMALTVQLAITSASRDTQTMFMDRVNDTVRFASLAETALRTGHTSALEAELRQYEGLYGIGVIIVGRDGGLLLVCGAPVDFNAPWIRDAVDDALSGNRSATADIIWPWSDEPLVVIEPVGRGGEVVGAAMTLSPTARLRGAMLRGWAVLAAQGLAVLLIGAGAAFPLTRWLLRPVRQLDRTAHALAEGRLGERVGITSGPPELRRLTKSFDAMAEQLSVLIDRQRAFVSYAGHQLRTPLARLRLSMDNLAPAVLPAGCDDHQMVVEEIERMARLYDALLTYASVEAASVEVGTVDLAEIADTRVARWAEVAEEAGVVLCRTGERSATASAAADTIDQVLDALIENAVKFAGVGSRVTVAVEATAPDQVAVRVIDDGPGMPEEDLRRAIEPFWRHPKDQNLEGSGLGVTIAHALVTACGGTLELLAADPRGLEVSVRLPTPAAVEEGGIRS